MSSQDPATRAAILRNVRARERFRLGDLAEQVAAERAAVAEAFTRFEAVHPLIVEHVEALRDLLRQCAPVNPDTDPGPLPQHTHE